MINMDPQIRLREHRRLLARFPVNRYVRRLVAKAEAMGISFAPSPVAEQWLYHPEDRIIYVWEPDLERESLSYIVVVLAHELGHAVDFSTNPLHLRLVRDLHWSQVPVEIEVAAFVQGFRILKELSIPVSLDQYERMISPAIAATVRRRLETYHLCCLLSHAGAAQQPAEAAVS